MNFIFAKLFEEYIRKNDPAEFKIAAYITVFYFMLLFILILPIKTYVDKKIFENEIHYEKTSVTYFIFGLLILIFFLVYNFYIKKKYIYNIVKKNKNRKINKIALYLLIMSIPSSFLLLGGIITVYLCGGEVLGQQIKGLLE